MVSLFQRSLGGGVVSTSLIPRADTAKVQAGVKDMRNFWATRSGSAQNRPGFRHVATCKDQHDDLRIERFAFNDEQAYAIEVGERYFRFYQFAEGAPAPVIVSIPPVVEDDAPVTASYFMAAGLGEGADEDDLSLQPDTQTLYLRDTSDDLAALDITLPPEGDTGAGGPLAYYLAGVGFAVPTALSTFFESSLSGTSAVASQRSATSTSMAGGNKNVVHHYSTGSGNPGADAIWANDAHVLTLTITSFINFGSIDSIILRVYLGRVNAAGVVQEVMKPATYLPPGSGSLAYTDVSGVNVSNGSGGGFGLGAYVFTFSDVLTTEGNAFQGPFADTDRLIVTVAILVDKFTTATATGVEYELNTSGASLVTYAVPVAQLGGTLPSASPSGSTEGFLNKRLRLSEGPAVSVDATGPVGSNVSVHAYTTLAGFPGDADAWVVGDHTLAVKITAMSNLTSAELLPRLHRTDADGEGQELCDAGGIAAGDPTSVILPDESPGTLTADGVDIFAEGVGVYLFTWTDAVFAGPFLDGDRLTVELIFTMTASGDPGVVTYEANTADAKLTTAVAV